MPSLRSLIAALAMMAVGTTVSPGTATDTSGLPLVDGTPLCGVESPSAPEEPAADDNILRVATFNLLHSDTDDGDRSLGERLPLQAREIVTSGADVIGVQEATRNQGSDPANEYPQKHGLVVQRLAGELAERTGEPWEWCWSQSNPHVPGTPDVGAGGGNPLDEMAATYGNTPDPGDFAEGIAILTRFTIAQARFRRLAPRSYEAAVCLSADPICYLDSVFDGRQVLWAHIQDPGGEFFDVFNTHIAHGITSLSDSTKLLQVQQAVALIDQWATSDSMPDFLTGDFNSSPDSDRHQALIDAGFVDTYLAAGGSECVAVGDAGCTGNPADGDEVWTEGPARSMGTRIDYVWARPSGTCHLKAFDARLIGDQPRQDPDSPDQGRPWMWPSDHLGVVSSVSC